MCGLFKPHPVQACSIFKLNAVPHSRIHHHNYYFWLNRVINPVATKTQAKLSGGKKGDMPDLMIRNGRLFLNEKAHECLREVLGAYGEFLPVTLGREVGYLFYILKSRKGSL